MGKKRIIKKSGGSGSEGSAASKLPKKKLDTGILHIQATYNNTILLFTDMKGNAVMSASSGSAGFKGARKSTPFAAAKVGELIGEKAAAIGVKEAEIIVKGVGSGRESSIRAFANKGINIKRITDMTPVPHNGPRPPRARRV